MQMVFLAGTDKNHWIEYIVWKGKMANNIIFGEKGYHEWKARGIYWKRLFFPTLFPVTFPTNTKWGFGLLSLISHKKLLK